MDKETHQSHHYLCDSGGIRCYFPRLQDGSLRDSRGFEGIFHF